MPDSGALWAFVLAAFVVLVIPGPAVLYVITRSLSQGRTAGFASVLGLSAGALVHVAAAAVGLSALLLASATAFGIVKMLGAFYLIFLGIRALLSRPSRGIQQASTERSLRRVFTDGILVSILNPKIAVFFLAFLPQFVTPNGGPVARQILFLGLLYVALALVTDGVYALVAGSLRSWLRQRMTAATLPQRATGIVYLGLGVGLALADRRH